MILFVVLVRYQNVDIKRNSLIFLGNEWGFFFLLLTHAQVFNSNFNITAYTENTLCEDVNKRTIHNAFPFLGGLSLHLNHLIASRAANYNWPFGTLPFGLFGSNLDTRDLETYPRTYSGHF